MEKLTVELAKGFIKGIVSVSEDDAKAHIGEDELRDWFVKCVAAGMYDMTEAVQVASIVITTKDIVFSRWYE